MDAPAASPPTITHEAHVVASSGDKVRWLTDFLRTRSRADDRLRAHEDSARIASGGGWPTGGFASRRCTPIDRRSSALAAVEGFRGGRVKVLVATDIAARGLDIDGIGYIINYEVPGSVDTYVHRVGRTGRAEATGHAR